ncbi:hypothetical protein ACTXT7_008034 [Hymenolepis weldensis]
MDIAGAKLEFGKASCSKYFDKYCPVKDSWNPHCAYRKNKSEEQYEVLNISPSLYKHCTTCGIKQIYETNGYAYKIYGGRESVPHSWPWIAGMYESTTGGWYAHVTLQNYTRTGMICAASLISEKYAITAAHCLIEPKKQVMEKRWYLVSETLKRFLFLRFGDHHRSNWWFEPQVDVPILGFTIYKSDNDEFFGDVAILELEGPVSFNNYNHKFDKSVIVRLNVGIQNQKLTQIEDVMLASLPVKILMNYEFGLKSPSQQTRRTFLH